MTTSFNQFDLDALTAKRPRARQLTVRKPSTKSESSRSKPSSSQPKSPTSSESSAHPAQKPSYPRATSSKALNSRGTQPPRSSTPKSVDAAASNTVQPSSVVHAPSWLRYLQQVKKITAATAALSTCTVVGLYLLSVNTQHRWNLQYAKLDRLQSDESQYLLNNEALTRSLRDTVANGDMVPMDPGRAVRLPAAQLRPQRQLEETNSTPLPVSFPTGY